MSRFLTSFFNLCLSLVLQLPGRETHDRYDDGWDELLNGKKNNSQNSQIKEGESNAEPFVSNEDTVSRPPQRPASGHRKKLFYFDAE